MTDDLTPLAPLSGGCMCGTVRFSISEPLLAALYCYCKRCQRRTGTGFSVSGLTQAGSFELSEGEDAVATYDPGDGGWRKSFCGECGSQLFDYAAPWAPVPDDGKPRFGERMA